MNRSTWIKELKMTTTNKTKRIIGKNANDALIDQLRACQNSDEIIRFDKWFNSNIESEKLYKIICDLLKNRSISRALAAKWLITIIEDKERVISDLSDQKS